MKTVRLFTIPAKMSRTILLIGGPKHGETFELKDSEFKFPIDKIPDDGDMLRREQDWTYVICQTADGVFYGVYNPLADPSLERVKMLREMLGG